MSNKVKNAETKVVTDSQVTAAQVGVVQPANALKASVKQAQDKAVQALTAAELAKKKALEDEEAKLKEQSEESAQAESDESAEPASAQAVAEQSDEAVAQADETTVEDIEAVAKQLDDTAAGLDMAARDLGMMFAQAGGAAAAGTTAGVSTTAIVAGAVVVGAAVAASDSGSSTGVAASSSSSGSTTAASSGLTTFAAITPLVSAVSVNLAPTQALTSALTQAPVSTVSGTASLSTLAFPSSFTYATPTTLLDNGSDFKAGVYTAATGSGVTNENQIISVTSAGLTAAGAAQTINGGAGTDIVRATLNASTTSALTLQNVEVVQVKNTSVAAPPTITVSTDNFGDVKELWNYQTAGTTPIIGFIDVESTATVIGINNTGSDTSVTYAAAASGGSTVTAVLVDSLASSSLTLDSSAIVGGSGVTKLLISSNAGTGTGANVLNGVTVSTTTTTLDLIGNRALSLSAVDTDITTINAAGMIGNFTLDMGALAATNAAVIGGAGTNSVTASLGTTAALGMTRVPTLNLTLTGAATLTLTDTTGLTSVNLSGTAAAATSFKGLQTGVGFVTKGGLNTGATDFVYRDLSDFTLGVSGSSATTMGNIGLEGVRNASITSSVTAGNSSVGTITVGASTASVNAVSVTNTGAVNFTTGAISSAQASPLVVNLTTNASAAAGLVTAGGITSKADATVNLSATKAAVSTGGNIVSSNEDVVVVANAVSANATVAGAITAEGSVGLTLTGAASGPAIAQFSASVTGATTARTGDIGAILTAQASSGTSNAAALVSAGNFVASEGDIGLRLISQGGVLGSTVTAGTLTANDTINVSVQNSAGGTVTLASTAVAADTPSTTIDSNSGSVGISIVNDSSISRQGVVTIARDTDGTPSVHVIEAAQDIAFVATNNTNGVINAGNLSAQAGEAFVNVSSGEQALVRMGTVSAAGDVTIAFAAGNADANGVAAVHRVGYTANAGTAATSTSSTGDVNVAIAVAAKSDVQVGNLAATVGNITIGDSADLGKNSVGNSGVVVMDVAANGSLTFGTIQASGVSAEGGTVTFGTSKNTIDLGTSAVFTAGTITSDDSLDIRNFTLANSAHLNLAGGATSNSGTVTVSPTAGNVGSRMTLGAIQGSGDVSLSFGGNTDSIVNFAGVTSQFGNVDIDFSVGQRLAAGVTNGQISSAGAIQANGNDSTVDIVVSAGSGAQIDLGAISATKNVSLDITTGVATNAALTNANSVTSLTSALGDVSVKAAVNSSTGTNQDSDLTFTNLTATVGKVIVDSASTVGEFGALALGTISATGANGSVSVEGIDVQESGVLTATAITARGNIDIGATLGVNATLSSTGAVTSNDGSVSITSSSGAVGSVINFADNIAAGPGGSVSITVSSGLGGSLNVANTAGGTSPTISAGAGVTVVASVGATGTASGIGEGGITSTTGNIDVTVANLSTAATVTSVGVGNIAASLGNVIIRGASDIGARGATTFGTVTASGTGSSVSVGSSTDAVAIASRGAFAVSTILSNTNVEIYTTMAAGENDTGPLRTQTLLNGAVTASNGAVTISALGGTAQHVELTSGNNVTAQGNVTITFTGGVGSDFDLGAATTVSSTSSDVTISATVGAATTADQLRLQTGAISATSSAGDIVLTLAAGREANIEVANGEAISAGRSITVNATAGVGTTNVIGSGGLTTTDGDIAFNLSLLSSSAAADRTSLTFGAVTANQGDVNVLSRSTAIGAGNLTTYTNFLGDSSTLTFGGITTTGLPDSGQDINFGRRNSASAYERLVMQDNSALVTGALTAEGDIGIYAIMGAGADILSNAVSGTTATNVISNNGAIRVSAGSANAVSVLGDGAANTVLNLGRYKNAGADADTAATIRAEDAVEIGFVGGFDSRAYLGNIRVFEGHAILNLITENSTAQNDAIRVGNIEVTGDINTRPGFVTINAHGGSGSRVQIASGGTIVADDDINLTVAVGEGVGARSLSNVGTGAAGIISNDGTITVTSTVTSTNSLSTSSSTLTYGALAAYDGDIVIHGDTLVETQGRLIFGNISAGRTNTATAGDIDIGSLSNRVEVRYGGLEIAAGDESTLFQTGNLRADGGNISAYLNLGDGALATLGTVTTTSGNVVIDVTHRNIALVDNIPNLGGTFGLPGLITIGNVSAAGTVNLSLVSSAVTAPSTGLSIGTVAGTNVTITYNGSGTGASTLQGATAAGANMGAVTYSGVFTANLTGSAAVILNNGFSASTGSRVFNATGLTGGLTAFGNASADTFTVNGGTNALTGAAGNDVFNLNGGSNTVGSTSGNNVVNVTAGVNALTLGTGDDTVNISGGTNATVILDTATTRNVVNVTASSSNTITGAASSDVITLSAGTNTVDVGDTATNTVSQSGGNSTITGGTGVDIVTVSGGTSVIDTEAGNDTISVTAGSVTITAGANNDVVTISGTTTSSNVTLTSGNNTLTVSAGNTTITAGSNNDFITVSSTAGTSSVTLTGGTNTLSVQGGATTITGGTGSDVVTVSGPSSSSIDMSAGGTNTVTVSSGITTVVGGAGSDAVTINSSVTSFNVSLGGTAANTLTVNSGTGTITGGDAADVVTIASGSSAGSYNIDLGAAANTLTAAQGNLTVVSGSGADVITLNTGVDSASLQLDAGNNTVSVSAGPVTLVSTGGDDVVSITSGGALNLDVGAGNNSITVTASVANTTLLVAATTGNDTVVVSGTMSSSVIDVGAGTNTVSVTSGTSTITGGGGVDLVTVGGSAGATSVSGAGGADTITGGTGNDVIDGGADADVLTGGLGADVLTGGAGADDFVLTDRLSTDTIVDFTLADDDLVFDISSLALNSSDYAAGAGVAADVATVVALASGAASNHVIVDTAANIATFNNATGTEYSGAVIAIESDTGRVLLDADGNFAAGSIILAQIDPLNVASGNIDFIA